MNQAESNPDETLQPGQRSLHQTGGSTEFIWRVLAQVNLPLEGRGAVQDNVVADNVVADNEGIAENGVTAAAKAVEALNLSPASLDRLKIAVRRATLNAATHARRRQPAAPVYLRVLTANTGVVTELGEPAPSSKAVQSSRGWGFFVIEKLADGDQGEPYQVVELCLYLEGGGK